MRQVKYVLLAIFLGAFLFSGCSKRKNPADPTPAAQGNVVFQPVFFRNTLDTANNALIFNNLRPEPAVRRVRVYLPPGYQPRGQGRPFPTLYLLHDFGVYPDVAGNITGGTDTYFGFYELAHVMDQLIAAGEIKPMIVVQTDLANFYGGSFYTNSTSTARFFTAIDSFLVDHIDRTYNTVFGRRSRAVSGQGMGGYGALKLVLTGNDTTFGSVSALSAPLAFGDSGSGMGFQSPFYISNGLFAENGVALSDCVRFRRDTVLFPDPRLTQKIRTNILFALGAALSPVADTALFKQKLTQGRRDSLLAAMPEYFQFSKSPKDPGFLFPITCNGTIIDSVWRRWLTHDIKTMLSDPSKAARFDSTPFYFSCGLQDELAMLDQNRDLLNRLIQVRGSARRAGSFIGMGRDQFYYEEYSGYPGYPADHTTFISDQLAKTVKFHSQFLDTAGVP